MENHIGNVAVDIYGIHFQQEGDAPPVIKFGKRLNVLSMPEGVTNGRLIWIGMKIWIT